MRVGFVGCGTHATRAVYPCLAPAGLELAAICARHLDHAAAAARSYGATAYDNVAEMLTRERLDGVLVSLPHEAYESVIGACIVAGTPVWAEKPAGGSADSLRRLEDAAARAAVPVMVGYMKRFAPAYRRAFELANDSSFGPLTSLHVRFVVGAWAREVRHFVVDGAVHALDLLRFFGGEAASVRAAWRPGSAGRIAISVLAELESGALATAQLGTVASFEQECEQLDLFGEGHALCVRNVDTLEHRPPTGPVLRWRPSYTVPLEANFSSHVMGFVPELRHWRSVVEQGAHVESDLTSARRTLELAERVLATEH